MFVWNSAVAGGGEGGEHGGSDGSGGGFLASVRGREILGQNAELVVLLEEKWEKRGKMTGRSGGQAEEVRDSDSAGDDLWIFCAVKEVRSDIDSVLRVFIE